MKREIVAIVVVVVLMVAMLAGFVGYQVGHSSMPLPPVSGAPPTRTSPPATPKVAPVDPSVTLDPRLWPRGMRVVASKKKEGQTIYLGEGSFVSSEREKKGWHHIKVMDRYGYQLEGNTDPDGQRHGAWIFHPARGWLEHQEWTYWHHGQRVDDLQSWARLNGTDLDLYPDDDYSRKNRGKTSDFANLEWTDGQTIWLPDNTYVTYRDGGWRYPQLQYNWCNGSGKTYGAIIKNVGRHGIWYDQTQPLGPESKTYWFMGRQVSGDAEFDRLDREQAIADPHWVPLTGNAPKSR